MHQGQTFREGIIHVGLIQRRHNFDNHFVPGATDRDKDATDTLYINTPIVEFSQAKGFRL